MRKLILAALLGLCAGLIEVGGSLMTPWLSWRPLLALVVVLLLASERSRTFAAALGGALLIDAYSIGAFNAALLRWIILVFILDFLARHLLTNRSLTAALAMTLAGRLLERFSSWIFGGGLYGLGWILLWDGVAVTAGFLLLAFFTKRFLPAVRQV